MNGVFHCEKREVDKYFRLSYKTYTGKNLLVNLQATCWVIPLVKPWLYKSVLHLLRHLPSLCYDLQAEYNWEYSLIALPFRFHSDSFSFLVVLIKLQMQREHNKLDRLLDALENWWNWKWHWIATATPDEDDGGSNCPLVVTHSEHVKVDIPLSKYSSNIHQMDLLFILRLTTWEE